MKCPNCGKKVSVIDSRERNGTIERVRECQSCAYKFLTKETFVRKLSWWHKDFGKQQKKGQ